MQFIREHSILLTSVLLVAVALTVWGVTVTSIPPGKLTVAVVPNPAGYSLYIESPTGERVLVDAGPDDSLLSVLPKLMPLGDRRIDAVIETYPDANHIGGLLSILRRYEVKNFIEPGIPKQTLLVQALNKQLYDQKIPRKLARQGLSLDLGGGAEIVVLAPAADPNLLPPSRSKEGSVLLELRYGAAKLPLIFDLASISSNMGMIVLTSDGKTFFRN
jgi:competence protein ComEC